MFQYLQDSDSLNKQKTTLPVTKFTLVGDSLFWTKSAVAKHALETTYSSDGLKKSEIAMVHASVLCILVCCQLAFHVFHNTLDRR